MARQKKVRIIRDPIEVTFPECDDFGRQKYQPRPRRKLANLTEDATGRDTKSPGRSPHTTKPSLRCLERLPTHEGDS